MDLREFLLNIDSFDEEMGVYFDGVLPIILQTEVVLQFESESLEITPENKDVLISCVDIAKLSFKTYLEAGPRPFNGLSQEEAMDMCVRSLNWELRPYLPKEKELVEKIEWATLMHNVERVSTSNSNSPKRIACRRQRWQLGGMITWEEFKNCRQEGDEVWRFIEPQVRFLTGKSGYVLVRNGKMVAAYIVFIS